MGSHARWLALAVLAVVALSCGPGETPEQRLERLRYNHDIVPVGWTTIADQEGNPSLVVDLHVANQGSQKLNHLTVLVRARNHEGVELAARRVTLDLSEVQPGVGVQMAARVPGVEVGEGGEVMVEIESNLPPEVLRTLPEYGDVATAS